MYCFRYPTQSRIQDYLFEQADQHFSYGILGCTRDGTAASELRPWSVDRHRVMLGRGAETFQQARAAIEAWKMFPAETTTVFGQEKPREGLTVAVLFHAWPAPLWLLMPARVVYVVEDSMMCEGQLVDRFGFAYGTLPDHPERGEERFLVEWNRGDDSVHYDLLAISQPQHWLVRLGYPYARHEQARFRRLSGLAMQRTVAESIT